MSMVRRGSVIVSFAFGAFYSTRKESKRKILRLTIYHHRNDISVSWNENKGIHFHLINNLLYVYKHIVYFVCDKLFFVILPID